RRSWPSPVAPIMRQHLSQEASSWLFTGRSASTALCCSSRPAFTTQPLSYETMVGRLKKTNLQDRKEPRSLPDGFRQHRFRTIHIGQKVGPKFMGALSNQLSFTRNGHDSTNRAFAPHGVDRVAMGVCVGLPGLLSLFDGGHQLRVFTMALQALVQISVHFLFGCFLLKTCAIIDVQRGHGLLAIWFLGRKGNRKAGQ